MPEWYKNAPIFIKNKKNISDENEFIKNKQGISSRETNHTIKKCMPVFDTLTSGYILKIPGDITVYQSKINANEKDYKTHFAWTDPGAVSGHDIQQVEGYPHLGVHTLGFPKFLNPWIIKTQPGYSCLFTTPMHRGVPFTIIPGIVDTDTFDYPVNFPFQMNEKGFEGVLKAGTPMVQVIPFKRDEFISEVYLSDHEYKEKYPKSKINTENFLDSYKKNIWHKKIFR
jgi:hypothetical protein